MVNIVHNKCQENTCKEIPIFGFLNKKKLYCLKHKKENMINLFLENKCSVLECSEEYSNIFDKVKYCNSHTPNNNLILVKRLCKYCDIKDESDYICKDCKNIKNKKEWAIVKYLRKNIITKFEYDSSKMLQGCSKKRPDIYFELDKHCVIVEIDENQHNSYEDKCECARINEIVNGIGGKSVIIIRYNPDVVKNKNKVIEIKQSDRIELLVKIIKEELVKDYESFIVKIIQIYYNDNYDIYEKVKIEDITKVVCI
jgi:very-short-patch-repair endonuclease